MNSLKSSALVIAPFLLILASCQEPGAKMGRGFRLPEGNTEQGQAAFVALQCNQCHTVVGTDLQKSDIPSDIAYELGGEVRRVKSYGELVTAIIQPQHIISPEFIAKLPKSADDKPASPMPSANDRMTVRQLTDIVTYLHSHYQKVPPAGSTFPHYLP